MNYFRSIARQPSGNDFSFRLSGRSLPPSGEYFPKVGKEAMQKAPSVRRWLPPSYYRLLFAFAIITLLPIVSASGFRAAAQVDALPVPTGTPPAALIKRVMPLTANGTTSATVSRSGSRATVASGLLLYLGDVIETEDAKITVLFLDDPFSERDNEVIIDAGSRVRISSTYSWWGTVWAKVKGAFNSKTTYAQAGATGTEYEFTVINPTRNLQSVESAWLVVLEGSVEITKDPAQLKSQLFQPLFRTDDPAPRFILAGFKSEAVTQERYTRTLDVPAGEITTVLPTYHLFNECKLPHQIEFRLSDTAKWLMLEGTRRVTLQGQQTLDVPLQLVIDAGQLTPGRYDAHVYAVCLDCASETRCPAQQLDFPLSINVVGGKPQPGTTPTPTPTPTPSVSPSPVANQKFAVKRLEHSMVTRGFDQPETAQPSEIQSALTWTNQVLLHGQPTYATRNLIPHFNSIQERSQDFITAREQAIRVGSPGSQATLGDVYSDWGQGAWASFAYEKALGPGGAQSTVAANLAEAYRLAGRLDEAAKRTASLSTTVASQNLLGNLALDRARIALDAGNYEEANAQLEQAANYYSLALKGQSSPQSQPGRPPAMGVVQANISEANLNRGEVALRQRDPADAQVMFAAAARALEVSQNVTQLYPFPITDLGVAYRGLADAAMLTGDRATATGLYEKAKQQHQLATNAHKDFAEAYFNLGDLFEDIGDFKSAKANYWLAIQWRPEQPAPYYPLAVLLQDENPRLAAAMAATYLKLQPAVFNHGEKGANAGKIARGEKVIPPPRIGNGAGTTTESRVPDLLNKTVAEAQTLIETAGFVRGRVDEQHDPRPAGVIIDTTPAAGSRAARGASINLIVSAGTVAPTETTVPNLVSRNISEATDALKDVGLKIGAIERKPNNRGTAGTVIQQTPKAGAKVVHGSSVDVVVIARKPVEVPDLKNDELEKARKKISDKQLRVGEITERETCSDAGRVIDQLPAKHTPVEVGSAVNVVLGTLGTDARTMPNVVGIDANEARDMLHQRGFQSIKQERIETNKFPQGAIGKQSPDGGKQFGRQCPADVVIWIAVPLTQVGNYRGLPEDSARSQVAGISLTPAVRYQMTDASPAGTVIDQFPLPGSEVRSKSTVTLTVATTPQYVEIPPTYNLPVTEAREKLQARGLKVKVKCAVAGKYDIGIGWTAGTEPEAGTKVLVGTIVNLLVGQQNCGP